MQQLVWLNVHKNEQVGQNPVFLKQLQHLIQQENSMECLVGLERSSNLHMKSNII